MSESEDDHDRTPGILTVKLGFTSRLTLPADLIPTRGSSERWRPYVIGEYDGFQLSSEAGTIIGDKGAVSWDTWQRPFKFEVTPSSPEELTLSFFISTREPGTAPSSALSGRSEPQVISLGLVNLNPFSISPGQQKVDIQNGTGKLDIEISYTQSEIAPLGTWRAWEVRGEESADCLVYVKKKDTGLSYGMEVIDARSAQGLVDDIDINVAPSFSLRSAIQHPFIAPLKFAFVSSDGRLKLLAPLASGGYLFDHMQRELRLGVSQARFYAAELVSIVEYLHGRNIILGSLKLENILLDSSGHVSLCKPSLFGFAPGSRDCILPGASQYPAPEDLLDGRANSRAGDWWSLGVILHELLIGMPPFYHKDSGERQRRILHHDLQLPVDLPASARDILLKLLDRDPTHRLGVNMAAEVKAHPFFYDIEWDGCLRKFATPFKPHDATVVFWREPYTYKVRPRPEGEQREIDGVMHELPADSCFPLWRPIGPVPGERVPIPLSPSDNEDWRLAWERADGELYFENQTTAKRVAAKPKPARDPIQSEQSPAGDHPSQPQKKDALEAAFKAGYGKHLFSQILSYGVDLNCCIHDLDLSFHRCDSGSLSPLEWAVEYERLDLIYLFLDNGADPNFPPSRDGPAIVKAVRQKHQPLVEILVQRSDRVSCTRALAYAVEQQDTTLVTTLLANGVRCDFEESDRPLPFNPELSDLDFSVILWRKLETQDLTPPLVRAARLGDAHLAKLLLTHGADANVAYHDLGGHRDGNGDGTGYVFGYENEYPPTDDETPVCFSCGRAVQIAMEKGHVELVRLLVDAGADINLAHSPWCVPCHVCQPVPRAVYLEVVDGLKRVVAGREGNEGQNTIPSSTL